MTRIIGKQHVGYLKNDNRVSGGALEESDVKGCNHCQKIMTLADWRKKGGWCYCCDNYVCFSCVERTKKEGCVPWRKFVDRQLEAQAQRRQLEKAFGLGG